MASSDPVRSLSAVTLVTTDMAAACAFYDDVGLLRVHGGPAEAFTSYRVGAGFLNLQRDPDPAAVRPVAGWGRAIFWVEDVDALHRRLLARGRTTETTPADAPWGERYFHVRDPDGHELSFARPLDR